MHSSPNTYARFILWLKKEAGQAEVHLTKAVESFLVLNQSDFREEAERCEGCNPTCILTSQAKNEHAPAAGCLALNYLLPR